MSPRSTVHWTWSALLLALLPAFVVGQARARLGLPVGAAAIETTGSRDERTAWRLDDLVQISLEQNPALRQAGLDVEAARGLALQAGLYPNPMISIMGDELGGSNGRQGGMIR